MCCVATEAGAGLARGSRSDCGVGVERRGSDGGGGALSAEKCEARTKEGSKDRK